MFNRLRIKPFGRFILPPPNRCRFEQAILEQWVSTVLVKATAKMTHLLAVVSLRMMSCLRIKPYLSELFYNLSFYFKLKLTSIDFGYRFGRELNSCYFKGLPYRNVKKAASFLL